MREIQLFKPKFRNQEIFEHIEECFEKGWTGLGFKTQLIEEEWKKYTELPHAHFLNSNTSGLHLAIKILKDVNKWEDGDEIITSPLTFVSSNHSILYERLSPVFSDVDETLCMDPNSLEKRITKKTRAVLFIGIGGNTGNFSRIVEICKSRGLKLILDAAHMSGTFVSRGGKVSHVGKEADVSVFSFQAVKNLPTADSGMICFSNPDYDSLARKLSWLGISKDTYQRTSDKGSYKWEYDVIDAGYKYHGNSIMASMALVGLRYLEEDNNRRREICSMYDNFFLDSRIDSIKTSDQTYLSSRHLYQIRVSNRDKIMEFLNSQGIYPGVHYRDNTAYRIYRSQEGRCPNSHKISQEIISLPLHLYLENKEVEYVSEMVKKANQIYNG